MTLLLLPEVDPVPSPPSASVPSASVPSASVPAAPSRADGGSLDAAPDFRTFFDEQSPGLVRLSALLVGDHEVARDIAQDVMTELYRRWSRFRTYGQALGYARTSVVNRSRNVLRHKRVVAAADPVLRHAAAGFAPAAHEGALDRAVLLGHVRTLPRRQQEVVVLRYWLDLSEADIADTLGISRGTVKSTAAKALARLTALMTAEDGPAASSARDEETTR